MKTNKTSSCSAGTREAESLACA